MGRSTGNNHAAEKKTKAPRFYPVDVLPPKPKSDFVPGKAKLRASITTGTVLIVLSGKYRGKRVVFLKQLTSGLLLVTGPYKVNGVPLRRMNQAYVAATSTKVDGVSSIAAEVSDDLFKNVKKKSKSKKSSEDFFANQEEEEKPELSDDFKALQKQVDDALVPLIKKTDDLLASYLETTFTLSKGQYPHMIKF